MPQVSDKFGPIYATGTVNASGIAEVFFQAQGANIRITNLFVRVSTSTSQANAIIYKGYVADGNQISNTNSGSTGGAAHGAIDLFDGEKCIVRWTGADIGATATATFVGIKLDFREHPTSTELTWDDPIAAGDGSLIYPALKSPNYAAGLTGWKIDRDGNAEFNDVDVRGTFTATGDDGNFISLVTGTQALIELRPPNFQIAPIPSTEIEPANIHADTLDTGTDGALSLNLEAPAWNPAGSAVNKSNPTIILLTPLYSGNFESAIYLQNIPDDGDLFVQVKGNLTVDQFVKMNNAILYGPYNYDTGKGLVTSTGLSTNSASIGATEQIIVSFPAFTYKAFRAYRIEIFSQLVVSVGPNRPAMRVRKTNTSGTQLAAAGIYVSGAASMHNGPVGGVFWVGATDVTCTLVITLAGGASYTVNSTGSPPLIASIYDHTDNNNVNGWAPQLT